MLIIMKIMQTTDEEDVVIVMMALDKMYQVRVNVGIVVVGYVEVETLRKKHERRLFC